MTGRGGTENRRAEAAAPAESGEAARKRELRARFRRERVRMDAAEAAEKSARIVERIAALPAFREASLILLYRAVPGEPDLSALTRHPASAGKRFAWPVCVGKTEMKAMVPGAWRQGMYRIPEPDPADSAEAAPEDIGLAVCPGVAFDRQGTRLGMGGGYYDRFLPKCVKARKILAAFEAQRAEDLPREETDVPMDAVVTEAGVYRPEA